MPAKRCQFPSHPRAWWRTAVVDFEQSCLSGKDFAQTINVHPDSVSWWCRRFAADKAAAAVAAANSVVRVVAKQPSRFVEVAVVPSVVLPPAVAVVEAQVGALTIRILASADAKFAGTLLGAVAKAVGPC